jgi:hypothetical protein
MDKVKERLLTLSPMASEIEMAPEEDFKPTPPVRSSTINSIRNAVTNMGWLKFWRRRDDTDREPLETTGRQSEDEVSRTALPTMTTVQVGGKD